MGIPIYPKEAIKMYRPETMLDVRNRLIYLKEAIARKGYADTSDILRLIDEILNLMEALSVQLADIEGDIERLKYELRR